MEDQNKNTKQLNFPNSVEAWQSHSQNTMMCLQARVFQTNEYTHHFDTEVHDTKMRNDDAFILKSQKGNVKDKTTPVKRQKEKVMVAEIMNLSNAFQEIPNRKFELDTIWDVLKNITTSLEVEGTTNNSIYSDDVNRVSNNILGVIADDKDDSESNNIDLNILDDNVLNAVMDRLYTVDDNNEETDENAAAPAEEATETEIVIGKQKRKRKM